MFRTFRFSGGYLEQAKEQCDLSVEESFPEEAADAADRPYTWKGILSLALKHKPRLVRANLLAIMATIVSVPIPLLLPVLVDEVLLDESGPVLPVMQGFLPQAWHEPVVYISLMVLAAFLLRLMALGFNVAQSREFSKISKDVVFRIRSRLLGRLRRVAMSEYESRGSGGITSHFITDLDTIDQFLGTTISRFIVASLTVIGTACVLVWVHWQLGLLILLFNPLVIFLTMLISKRVKELKRQENSAYEDFQGDLT
jgi:ATP-binding cassette subfamily C protein